MKTDIELIFKKLPKPKPSSHGIEDFSCHRFNNSNLWIVKDEYENCGFLIENCKQEESSLIGTYKNIDQKYHGELITNDITLKGAYRVWHKEGVEPEIFCDSLNSYFNKNLKNLYEIRDIIAALKEIGAITKRILIPLNEIIGVWGELYLIHSLIIAYSKNRRMIREIIESWESPNGRTSIDLKFNKLKLNIEVKTTTSNSRIHHISSINQVSNDLNWIGYLASICIKQGKGISCNNLVDNILKLLDDESSEIFLKRLIIRGKKICTNDKFLFYINNSLELRYFNFENVPKPKITDGVFNINWDIVLDELESISKDVFLKNIKPDI
tara:strand:+ start:641 stop:1618 length:978 start_codon:yes stop_codon:yes gene_type:complete